MNLLIALPDDLHPIGTKVYIPQPLTVGKVMEAVIIGYYGQVAQLENNYTFAPSDYRLNTDNLEQGAGKQPGWKADEFFLSYEAALDMAKVYPLLVDEDTAKQAIGYEEDCEGYCCSNVDESELRNCCGDINNIRWILARAINQQYITALARRDLSKLISAHDCPENCPALTAILDQIELTW